MVGKWTVWNTTPTMYYRVYCTVVQAKVPIPLHTIVTENIYFINLVLYSFFSRKNKSCPNKSWSWPTSNIGPWAVQTMLCEKTWCVECKSMSFSAAQCICQATITSTVEGCGRHSNRFKERKVVRIPVSERCSSHCLSVVTICRRTVLLIAPDWHVPRQSSLPSRADQTLSIVNVLASPTKYLN